MRPERSRNWEEDDWLFVAEALALRMFDPGVSRSEQERAWRLIRTIAREQGASPTEFVRRGVIGTRTESGE